MTFFDPDYRRNPWRNSKYAPKNRRGSNITGSAAMLSALTVVGVIALSSPLWWPEIDAMAYQLVLDGVSSDLGAARTSLLFPYVTPVVIAIGVLIFPFAMVLRTREWRRLQRLNADAPAAKPDDTTDPHARFRPPANRVSDFDFETPARSDGRVFEQEVAELIARRTGHRAVVVGGKGDGGVDIKVFHKSNGQLVGVVQCKHYAAARYVPPTFVRELATVRDQAGVQIAYLATTGRFGNDTKQEAERLGIRLIDGEMIARMRGERQPPP